MTKKTYEKLTQKDFEKKINFKSKKLGDLLKSHVEFKRDKNSKTIHEEIKEQFEDEGGKL